MRGITAVLVVALFAVAGCGGTSTIKGAANPQTRADVAKAEAIVKLCLVKNKTPKGFSACAAPKGHEQALEACATKALEHDAILHKSHLEPDLANCVVTNR